MLPVVSSSQHCRPAKSFELMTPDGRLYVFPKEQPGLRLARWVLAHGEVLAISTALAVLFSVVGLLAGAIEQMPMESCIMPQTRDT